MITIIARDNDKPGNVELVEYLSANLEKLVREGCRFNFKIIEESSLKTLVDNGITKLPAAMVNKNKFLGTSEIKTFLNSMVDGFKPIPDAQKPIPKEKEIEDIKDYFKEEMSMEAVEKEKEFENGDGKKSLMEKYQQEVQRRSSSVNPKKDNVSVEKPQAKEKPKTQGSNSDDDMLLKMMETTD